MLDEKKRTRLEESSAHWSKLADEQEEMAKYEESRGHLGDVYRNRAKLYRNVAERMQLHIRTGAEHCEHLIVLETCGPCRAAKAKYTGGRS